MVKAIIKEVDMEARADFFFLRFIFIFYLCVGRCECLGCRSFVRSCLERPEREHVRFLGVGL